MRTLTIQNEGVKLGTVGRGNFKAKPPVKTSIGGWSAHSIRRNNDFLREVDYSKLPAFGFAFTGTLKSCPPTSQEWHRVLNAFWRCLKRLGVTHIHWVIEWQRRGVPHLHCSLFFPDFSFELADKIRNHWLRLTEPWGSLPVSQYLTQIHDSLGWAKYTAKHAQRGLYHYQRSPENVPVSWAGRTGRMWGKWGDWSMVENLKFDLPDEAFFIYRRLLRNWRLADSRAAGNPKRIKSARNCLKTPNKRLSRVRGVSEWLPSDSSLKLLSVASVLAVGDISQID